MRPPEAVGHPGALSSETGNTFGKDAARALRLRATEAANGEVESDGNTKAGQVGEPAGVSAVDAVSILFAVGTRGRRCCHCDEDRDEVIDIETTVKAAARGSSEEFRQDQVDALG